MTAIKRGTARRLGLRLWRRIHVMVQAVQCDGCRNIEVAPDGDLPNGWAQGADGLGDFCPACVAAEPSPIVFRSGS